MSRPRLSLLAGAGLLAAACAERPSAPSAPPIPAPRRALLDARCDGALPGERLGRLVRGVEALPFAAQSAAQAQLLPRLRVAAQALEHAQSPRVAEALDEFMAEVEELRLRAMFEDRVALIREAQCLQSAVGARPE